MRPRPGRPPAKYAPVGTSVCDCCALPFRPASTTSYDDAPKQQTTCNPCLPHRLVAGEDGRRVEQRLNDHADRATRLALGALDEVARAREQINELHEQRRDRALSNDRLYTRLQEVAALHGQVADTRRCLCGLAVDQCRTLPLVRRYAPEK